MFRKYIPIHLVFFCFLHSQDSGNKGPYIKDYQLSSEQYITNDDGKVYMKINFWGASGESGILQVEEGIDFASLISMVGLKNEFVNLKKIRLYRETPDDNGQLVYLINLNPFLKTGDRSNFPQIKPNDTIVVRKKITGILLDEISSFQAILTALTFFIQFYTLINR
tara:strand:- start:120 stop:617 length:498 start_codon:yes stop_codon:yes gene_type:complete